jgi:two-component system CheB/CheR fusion protein
MEKKSKTGNDKSATSKKTSRSSKVSAKVKSHKKDFLVVGPGASAQKVAGEIDADDSLREILTLLRVRTGHDFSNYKAPTLVRRIARHLQIHELEDIPAYLELLRRQPDEINSLLKNLLINVTNFFRDKNAFEALEAQIIPNLFAGKTGKDTVRVWSCGCASGEEAYSLAMLLSEYADMLADPPKLQVFASDVDDESIAGARAHRYPQSIEADVSPDRLKRFFIKEGAFYRVKKMLRETVLFAPHNVLRDPPFSRLDLVSCRNLLIYLNRETQARVLQIFHFALQPHGYLFLGSSETAEGLTTLYAPVDKKHRIYARRPAPRAQNMLPVMPVPGGWNVRTPERKTEGRSERSSLSEIYYKLLENYAPSSVLVNQDFDIVYLSGEAHKFLRFSVGEPSRNLLKSINPELLPDLRAALFTAQREHTSSEFPNIRVRLNGEECFVDLIVRVIDGAQEASDYLLVIFEEKNSLVANREADREIERIVDKDEAMETVVRRLEDDLQRTREQLRLTIERHETTVEELKASNEELEAINEELTTVNHELKDKIDETSRINSDLQNLIAATDIATIFLDKKLRIKRYTPPVQEFFNITPVDVGRPLEHFTHKLNYEGLAADAEKALRRLATIEREITDAQNRSFLSRFAPYRTLDDRIDGVVLNFIDITERKKTERALRRAEEKFGTFINATSEIVYEMSADWSEMHFLKGKEFIATTETPRENWMAAYIPDEEKPRVRAAIDKALETRGTFELEHRVIRLDGQVGWTFSRAIPLLDERGEILKWFGAAHNTTGQKYAAEALRKSEEKYYSLFHSMDEGYCIIQMLYDESGNPVDWLYEEVNPAFEKHNGLKNARAKTIRALVPDIEPKWLEIYGRIAETGESLRFEESSAALNRIFDLYAFRVGEPEERKVAVLFTDVTGRKRAEEALRESEARLRLATEAGEAYSWEFDLTSETYKFSENAAKILGVARKNLPRTVADALKLVHPDDKRTIEQTLENAALTGEGFTLDFRTVTSRGKTVWLSVHSTVIGDEQGKPVRVVGIAQDITTRRLAEERIRESEERTRIAVEAVELATWEWDIPGGRVFWNEQHFKLFGMKLRHMPMKPEEFFEHIHPDDRERVRARLARAVEEKIPFEAEFRALVEKGETRWLSGYGRVTETDKIGKATRMSGVMFDITTRKIAEEALRKSEEKLQMILESTKDYAIVTFDLRGFITRWNTGAERIFGYPETEAVGRHGAFLFTPEDQARGVPEQEMKTALEKGRAEDERWHIRKNGERFFASGVMQPLKDGAVEGFVKICRDQTQRLVAETALREKETLQKLVGAQEEERKRIARDLHDELGQQLTALRIRLDALSKNYSEPLLLNQLNEIQNIARRLDDGVDFLAWELRPTVLEDLGLTAALGNYINQWSHYANVKAELTVSNLKRARFAPEVETCLYRIVQEALNNTHKHAEASRADVVLEKRGNELILIVEDNGKGFNRKSKMNRGKGMGLVGMQERATLIGGTLEIESAPKKGTTVYVRLPFSVARDDK